MVQPNTRIYPIPYITQNIYSQWEQHTNELARKMKTDIKFDYLDQCFIIKGRSQQACDNTSKRIETHLLPQLNKHVDEAKFVGTFEDLETMTTSSRPSPTTASSNATSPPMIGRPLNLEEVDKKHALLKGGGPSKEDGEEREAYYRYETESDEPEESDEEFVETFTFAKNINNPKEVLIGPITNNSKPPDYLRIIGNDTDTECSLNGRDVKIVGTCEETIKEALERFRNLQTIFKRRKRPTAIVPCVHYPTESPQFGLYFCSLEKYAHQAYVDTFNYGNIPFYVVLPVLKGKDGNYQKPKDMLTAVAPVQPPQWVMQQQQQAQMSLDERMRLASLDYQKIGYGNVNAGMAPDLTPLWGENKNYVVRTNDAPPRTNGNTPRMVIKKAPTEDFPSLKSSVPPPAPTIKKTQKTTRRVVRITGQKSTVASSIPTKLNLDIVREYNLYNIKSSLEDGLNGIRGFKGDIKLSAKLGKVLWTKLTKENQKKIWDFHDIKDVLVNEHGVEPFFSGMTTKSDEIITKMSEILPECYGRSAYFEINAEARNQPAVPYQQVTMFMNQGVVELKKIVTKSVKITEIDWVSLDRKFDFQMLLKAEETTRMDVKPYNTFIKKVAVDPNTRIITYENVPDFLEVSSILLKQTTKYRIHFPFVVEITRVERLPLKQQKFDRFGIEKIQGDTGKGQVWYDLEVSYSTYDEIFKANNDLPIGKLASWRVEDILGKEEDASNAIVEYIRCLLILVEKCESLV